MPGLHTGSIIPGVYSWPLQRKCLHLQLLGPPREIFIHGGGGEAGLGEGRQADGALSVASQMDGKPEASQFKLNN